MKNLIMAGVAAGMFGLWLTPGWWNLGFGIIAGTIWLYLMVSYPVIRKNWFLQILALSDLLLITLMWQRNNPGVKILSFLGWGLMTGTLIVLAKDSKTKIGWVSVFKTIGEGIFNFLTSGIQSIEIVKETAKKKESKKIWSVVVGLLLAIPLLLLFGKLFYEADPFFAQMVDKLAFFKINLNEQFWPSLVMTVIFFGGVFSLLKAKLVEIKKNKNKFNWQTEIGIVTSLVAVLFFVFGLIQIKYFVTGASELQKAGIMLSEYTRRGYGEMIAAGGLAFIMIVVLEQLVNSTNLKKLRIFFILEIIWLIAAATRRNYLYQDTFGLTQIRIIGAFLSLWLIGNCILYLKKMWNNLENGWFIKYAILLTGWVLILLNAVDVDRIIAVYRPPTLGYGIDYEYLSKSGADGYEGWEKVISYTENMVEGKKTMKQADYYPLSKTTWNLMNKYAYEFGPQAEGYWHNYGSWNLTSKMARRYMLDNWGRLLKLENKLTELSKNLTD